MPHLNANEEELDLRARAELALAYDVQEIPDNLFRHTPWILRRGVRRSLAALLVAASAAGAFLAVRPPALVRAAIDHEYYERTLRGSFVETRTLLHHLGLGQAKAVPGFPQLMRICDIEGHLVYHLTSFFEKGGMVTVYAFDKTVALKEDSGWWANVHWQVAMSKDGNPLVLVAQKKKALAVAEASFRKPPS